MKRSVLLLAFLALVSFACRLSLGFEPVQSKLMKVSSPSQVLSVELSGAKDLYLFADYGGDSYDCDQAIWADPKLIDKNGNPNRLKLVGEN